MRAARYHGVEDIRVEEIEEPVCGEGQVKVRPAFVGICGTGEFATHPNLMPIGIDYLLDLHEYLGGPTFAPRTPHPITKETIPITFGHEFSGTIVEVGKGVTGFTPGQPVSIRKYMMHAFIFSP
jgi:threonine dehydrogenase-like Zn-dependent dehydrogenase